VHLRTETGRPTVDRGFPAWLDGWQARGRRLTGAAQTRTISQIFAKRHKNLRTSIEVRSGVQPHVSVAVTVRLQLIAKGVSRMTNKKSSFALFALMFAASSAAYSQSATTYIRPQYSFPSVPPASGPASVELGDTPFYFTPYIGAAVGHDSNLFFSDINKKGSNMYVVSAGVGIDARSPNSVFQVNAQVQDGRYTSSIEDSYIDSNVDTRLDYAIDRRNFVRAGITYVRGHDPRGSTDRPFGEHPDKYRLGDPYFTYAFGAPGAQGRVEVYYSDMFKRYINNREFTAGSDRDQQEYGGAFYFRVMPRTYAMVEGREDNIRYKLPGSPFSADETRLYLGVSWEASAATTGTIKFGRLKRDFIDDTRPDFSGNTWEGLVTWAPRTYSKFDLYTARQTNESTGLGDFILTSIGGVTWTHNWTSYVQTAADVRYQRDAYQGFDRTDKTWSAGLKAGYKFRRWLTLGAEYDYWKRDSNLDIYDYTRNLFLITATASM
jgi:hypothetical protein